MATAPTVSCQWLREQMDGDVEKMRVLDVSWYSNKDGAEEFRKEHIPGSAHFDIMHGVENTPLYPRNIPSPETFEKYVRTFGINSNTHVIVYDTVGKGGFFIGSRAWWLFKLHGHENVSVLDGGFPKWKAEGYPTSTFRSSFSEGNFKAVYNKDKRVEFDAMVGNLSSSQIQVCDSRATEKYTGDTGDPKTGHYPGARNIPFEAQLLDSSNGTLKTPEQLKQVFSDAGVDLQKPIATMCNSGMSSCTLLLAATVCGASNAGVYHGGFTEWKTKAGESKIKQGTE